MNRILFISILILIMLSTSSDVLYGQEDCSVTLKNAEKMFDNGTIEDVPATLDMCLRNGFSKDEKLRAYRLMIISYLFDDKKDKADENMLKLLKLEPEYKVNKAVDPAEFVNLFEEYRTLPVYSLGVYGGINYSNIDVTEVFGVHNINNKSYDYHNSGMGYQFGIRLNRFIAQGLELCLEFGLVQSTYEYSDSVFSFSYVDFNEKQSRIDVPISFTYELEINKVKPYIRFGFNNSYMFSAYGTAVRQYTDDSHRDITGSDIELTEFRNKYNASLVMGIGAKYKVKRGHFFLEARYLYGLLNQTNENKRYTNPELIYKYYYIDNNFTLNNYMFSVGYMYSFYKPKKK